MVRTCRTATAIAALVLGAGVAAQPPAHPPTLEERVTLLEMRVASLDTRAGVRDALAPSAGAEAALAARVAAI
ncbi:MAG TPA: hypothetical protein VHH11_12945, partial [Gammaproteobacteria bacterium]|nr:hypothetical protein [Gammaproteobacteria bacterium]